MDNIDNDCNTDMQEVTLEKDEQQTAAPAEKKASKKEEPDFLNSAEC